MGNRSDIPTKEKDVQIRYETKINGERLAQLISSMK